MAARLPGLPRQQSLITVLPALLLTTACGSAAQEAAPPQEVSAEHNVLTSEQVADGWQLLFDGESLDGWRGFKETGVPDGWTVIDGTLARTGPGGDLITTEQFGNFELALDWRLEPGGNSGIFYRATENVDRTFESAPEMQVLDDVAHADGISRLTAAGANYALHAAPEGAVHPVGEWNTIRIIVDGAHVEHWLNGVKVVEYELWSPEWEALVQASKFVEWPEYGRAEVGHIGLQDHGDPVYYRNIRVRTLP